MGDMEAIRCCTPARESGDGVGAHPAPALSEVDASALAEGDAGAAVPADASEFNSAAEPSVTELSRSPTCRSYLGIIPLSTAPRARGPREIRPAQKIAGAAATTWGCFASRSISGGQSLIPSSAMRCRLICEVEPSSRCCRAWAKPLLH